MLKGPPVCANVPIAMSDVPLAFVGLLPSEIAMEFEPIAWAFPLVLLSPLTDVNCAKAGVVAATPIATRIAEMPPEPSEPRPKFFRFMPRARCAMRRTANKRLLRPAPCPPLTQLLANRS